MPTHQLPRDVLAGRAWIAVVIAAVAAACLPAAPVTPSTVGVVAHVEVRPGGVTVLALRGGAQLVIDPDDRILYPGPGTPRVGDLILYGRDRGGAWYALLPGGPGYAPDRCYPLPGPGEDRGSSIDTKVGLRLPKAPNFDPHGDTGGHYDEFPLSFCINERGQVVEFGIGF